MMNKDFKYLIVAFLASALPLIINRLIVPVPDFIYVICILLSVSLLVTYVVKRFKANKKK